MLIKILVTVAAVGGINGILAVLLVIAERFFTNYGECIITVNGEKSLRVQGGSSLLSSLKNEKIFLPSACGGRGTCAYCKCKVTEGGGTVLPTEESLLTTEEINDQIRLSCQIKVKSDITIQIPEALFRIKEFEAEVVLLKDLTYDIKLVRLRLIEPDKIRFTPGQYVQLENSPYEGVKESVSRAYSIASPSSETDSIDLMIRLVPEGIVTTWVHRYLEERERVKFTGPIGDFCLHEGTGEIVMVAGGSGMAPMVSLLSELARSKSNRKITFFFGAVSSKDLFYIEEMKHFEKEMTHFAFVPALSQPAPGDEWRGERGLITVPLENHLRKTDNSESQAYLCGSPGMINGCISVLTKNGLTDDRIFFDPFA